MKLSQHLFSETVWLDAPVRDKRTALRFIAEKISSHTQESAQILLENLLKRENVHSTSVGRGVAIPHCRLKNVKGGVVCGFLRPEAPVDFESFDRTPSDLIFMLISDEDRVADHLRILAKIARLCRTDTVRERLRSAKNPQEILNALCQ